MSKLTKTHDAVAYLPPKNGAKGRYRTIGALFENERGERVLKIDQIPVGNEWEGWVNFYEPKARGVEPAYGDKPTDDDIPF